MMGTGGKRIVMGKDTKGMITLTIAGIVAWRAGGGLVVVGGESRSE